MKHLVDFQAGETALVMAVNLGEKDRLRLESMGILPGVEISVLEKGLGPLIVAVDDSRLMMEQAVAGNIVAV